ncbi:MAG: HEAT repeat domain-containing protein [Methanolobus sp.]|nr:HEAT repeat domain-containing protein [Methanolobus sp.]
MIDNLGSENESVRTAAMDGLAEIGDERTVSSLVQVTGDENMTIEERKNAVTVLGRIGDDGSAEMLLNISMDEAEEKELRMASILALGEIGNETMLEPLRELSYGDDGLILYHAAYVLDRLEENYEVYASYGQLPYPLSEEQRLYRNNVYEISRAHRSAQENGTFPTIDNATTILIGYNIKSGYIEISSDVKPERSVMDNMYQVYDAEAQKRGVDQVPVRFVYGYVATLEGLRYSISDFDDFNLTDFE